MSTRRRVKMVLHRGIVTGTIPGGTRLVRSSVAADDLPGGRWMTRPCGRWMTLLSGQQRPPVQPWSRLTRRTGSRPGGWLGCGRGGITGTGRSCAFPAVSFTRLPWWTISSDPWSSSV